MKARLALILGIAAATSVLMACGSAPEQQDHDGDEVSAEEALSTKVTPGDFRLYDQPGTTPSQFCDVYTKFTLSNTKGARADLEEKLAGTCRMAVSPNPRYYRLKQAHSSCGSFVYSGSYKKNGVAYTVKVTDHRARVCEDVVPARIIVEETERNSGSTFTKVKYSLDHAAVDPIDAALENVASPAWSGNELTAQALEKALSSYLPRMQFMSESDDKVYFASMANPAGAAYTDTTVRQGFASAIKAGVYADYDYDVANGLGSEMFTPKDTKELFRGLAGDSAEWAATVDLLARNVKGLRLVKIGPGTESGFLKVDAGRYTYVFVGRTIDGKLAGIFFGATET